MAGWRIGFMVGNADLVHALARIKSYHDYGSFTPVQVACIAALRTATAMKADTMSPLWRDALPRTAIP